MSKQNGCLLSKGPKYVNYRDDSMWEVVYRVSLVGWMAAPCALWKYKREDDKNNLNSNLSIYRRVVRLKGKWF